MSRHAIGPSSRPTPGVRRLDSRDELWTGANSESRFLSGKLYGVCGGAGAGAAPFAERFRRGVVGDSGEAGRLAVTDPPISRTLYHGIRFRFGSAGITGAILEEGFREMDGAGEC